MRIAYFDCFSGISGDMILGALVGLGFDPGILSRSLSLLALTGYHIEVSEEKRGAIAGTRVEVNVVEETQPHRSLQEIRQLIAVSTLPEEIKKTSLAIFQRLAEVEGKIHQHPAEKAHFHEIGAVDSIVDIVGSCIGLHSLEIERVIASPLPLGRGFVRCEHGLLPLPAPATLALLKDVPVYDSGQQRELVTPTGAAIITTVASEFGGLPNMSIEEIAYGVGAHPEQHPPNLLRVIIGERSAAWIKERLVVLETSIDDMNPEFYGHLMERLLGAGALDVNILPAQMKKNRPGQLLRVLFSDGLRESVLQMVFGETTSVGVRIHEVERYSLPRTSVRVQTAYGRLPVKIAEYHEGDHILAPEYDACRQAAQRHGVPLRRVYEEAVAGAREHLRKTDTATQARGGDEQDTRGDSDTETQ